MAIAPSIFDTSIAQLTTLASALAQEMGTAADNHAGAEARACKEILLAVSVLLPKLRAAKHLLPASNASLYCSECDDS